MHDTTLPFSFDLPETVPFAFSLTALAEHLAPLIDQCKRRGKRYPLVPLLLAAVLAKFAGYARLEDLKRLGAAPRCGLDGALRLGAANHAASSHLEPNLCARR